MITLVSKSGNPVETSLNWTNAKKEIHDQCYKTLYYTSKFVSQFISLPFALLLSHTKNTLVSTSFPGHLWSEREVEGPGKGWLSHGQSFYIRGYTRLCWYRLLLTLTHIVSGHFAQNCIHVSQDWIAHGDIKPK